MFILTIKNKWVIISLHKWIKQIKNLSETFFLLCSVTNNHEKALHLFWDQLEAQCWEIQN